MNWTERRERFRAILSGNRCVHPGSVYDAVSARIAEDLGFEVGMFSGSIGSMSVLGAPDLVVLTLTEFAAQAYRICRAGNLALLVDADHGYGNALNVRRTVEELETAGICAMSIEDTVLPRPYGSGGKPSLSSVEEGVGKMRAALSARQDKNLVIAGRTSALAIANLDEALKRAKAYEAAGVDAVFLAGGVTIEAVEAVSSAIRIPLILGGGSGQLGDLDWLGAHRSGSHCRRMPRSRLRCRRSTTR
jgi:carboxyvinyl-carboxyphosphonate phosphorylmutase